MNNFDLKKYLAENKLGEVEEPMDAAEAAERIRDLFDDEMGNFRFGIENLIKTSKKIHKLAKRLDLDNIPEDIVDGADNLAKIWNALATGDENDGTFQSEIFNF